MQPTTMQVPSSPKRLAERAGTPLRANTLVSHRLDKTLVTPTCGERYAARVRSPARCGASG